VNNPFVAKPEADTTAITGIGLLEAGQAALDGINNGDWVEAGLGVVGAGLEALGLYMDPVGTLASYGVGWLIEHVQPLQDMLNDLAGSTAGNSRLRADLAEHQRRCPASG
jgi:hypothetical protein